MNSRLITSLLLAGTLAYACGPRSRSSDLAAVALAGTSTFRQSAAPATTAKQAPARPAERRDSVGLRAKIDGRLEVQVAPAAVRLAFSLTNVGPKHLELSFPNGQFYDFVVVDSTGREVWRWAAGRMFTQTVRNKQLSKGETLRLGETVPMAFPPGRYAAIATLNSSNYPVEKRTEFVVGPVSVATNP